MTTQQYNLAKPIRSSIVFHASQGCDVLHKTNEAMDCCEDKIMRKEEATMRKQQAEGLQIDALR